MVQNISILVVENDAEWSDLLIDIARKQGWTATVAKDLLTAQELIRKQRFTVIILDLFLNKALRVQNGLWLLDSMHDSFLENNSRPQVIVLTGWPDYRGHELQKLWEYKDTIDGFFYKDNVSEKDLVNVIKRKFRQAENPPSVSFSPAEPSDFNYDVFISYSSKDRTWVANELLPQLKNINLRICIDYIDFMPAKPSIAEMERAITTSRKTVAVITKNYIESAWTEFENLMLMTLDPANQQHRFVPLLKERVELPQRIKYLVYVDFTDSAYIDSSWKKLLKALAPS